DPSIELSSADISIVDAQHGRIGDDDDEADTHQRHKDGEVDEEAGTRPETPDLLRHRQPLLREPRLPKRFPEPPPEPGPKPSAGPDSRWSPAFDEPPTNTRPPRPKPVPESELPTQPPRDDEKSLLSRIAGALDLDRLRSGGIGLLILALIAVIAAGVV